MRVSVKRNKDILYLYLDGELDHAVAGELRRKIDELLDGGEAVKNVVLNMERLTFMDSTGVTLYDHDASMCLINDSYGSQQRLDRGKAIVQTLYDDLDER